MKGFTPALLSFLLVCNLNGGIMPVKIEYKKGQVLGECIYLHEVKGTNANRSALFKCRCGNEFTAQISNVKNYNTKSCGCVHKNYTTSMKNKKCPAINYKHGMSGHPLYYIWASMKARCFNSSHKSYGNYGGRGIAVCDEWRNDFKAFLDYVKSLPNYNNGKFTLDRIDNDGNYEPGNVRWATWGEQVKNRRPFSNKTGETGLYIPHKKYAVMIRKRYIGSYHDIKSAVIARDRYIKENNILIKMI